MTLEDPVVQWVGGGVLAVLAWIARTYYVRQEQRALRIETRLGAIETQQAAHTVGYNLIENMNRELQDLIKLTNRIAGHLKID